MDTPSVAEGRGVPQEELLEAAENALNWLYNRRAHLPEELLDHREAKHRKALRQAIRKASGSSPSGAIPIHSPQSSGFAHNLRRI